MPKVDEPHRRQVESSRGVRSAARSARTRPFQGAHRDPALALYAGSPQTRSPARYLGMSDETSGGLVRVLGALRIALERRIVRFQKPATEKFRGKALVHVSALPTRAVALSANDGCYPTPARGLGADGPGQITLRNVNGWQSPAQPPAELDLTA